MTCHGKLVHTEGNAGAAEAEGREQCLHQAQEAALNETHGECVVERWLCEEDVLLYKVEAKQG